MDKGNERTSEEVISPTRPGKAERKIFRFEVGDITIENLLALSKRFDPFILLNSNKHQQAFSDNYSEYDLLIGAGSIDMPVPSDTIFDSLKMFHQEKNDWIFGYFSYDIKNQVEKLHSENPDHIKAKEYFFFRPRIVIAIKDQWAEVFYDTSIDSEDDIHRLIVESGKIDSDDHFPGIELRQRVSKDEYLSDVKKIKEHIRRGDIYEVNYCMEFYADDVNIHPAEVYRKLNSVSAMPFSAFLKDENISLMCASPERFMAKRGKKIISQPIKGTAKRSTNKSEDDKIISDLRNSKKEQSENVMIVDLVRNDLSRTSARGSVKVEELFGINSFKLLHQMTSTIVSEMDERFHFTDVIRNAFPMGSMTGAPKVSAMKIIEKYEHMKRGIYSGSIGYITPDGDFDFNVIIRSILFNSDLKTLSYMAGSAITDAADPEMEYEECLLKAESMRIVLEAV